MNINGGEEKIQRSAGNGGVMELQGELTLFTKTHPAVVQAQVNEGMEQEPWQI